MSTPRPNQKRALLLVLYLTALSPCAALAGEKLLGTITSNGSSVNNLTAAVPFTLPSTVQTGGSRLALQCSTPAHYALGVDSSAAATTSDFLVNTELVLDVLGASVVAVRNDSASSTCRVFASSAPSRAGASGSSTGPVVSGTVTGAQGAAAAKAGAWPVYLTDGGLGSSADPLHVVGQGSATVESISAATPVTLTPSTATTLVAANAARLTEVEVINGGPGALYCKRGTGATNATWEVVLDPPSSGNSRGDSWVVPGRPGVWTGAVSCWSSSANTVGVVGGLQ